MKKLFFALLLLLCFGQQAFAKTAYEILDEIPVQHNGRVKPFASFAREVSFSVTGKGGVDGLSSSALVWSWIASPEKFVSKQIIPVPFKPLQKEFGVGAVLHNKISPETVLGHQPFLQKAREAAGRQARKETLSLLDKKRIELYGAAVLFQQIANGEMPGFIAHPEDPRAGWMPLQGFVDEEARKKLEIFYPAEPLARVSGNFSVLIKALAKDPSAPETVQAAAAAKKSLEVLLASKGVVLDQKTLDAEMLYDRMRFFSWAWKFYLSAAFLFALALIFENKGSSLSKMFSGAALALFVLGFGVHAYGFYLRCLIAGRPPVSNMYESIIWVSWAVALFSLALFCFYRSSWILLSAGLVSSLALGVAESFPAVLDPSITPLVPVLRSNLWLTIHVLTITLSYGAFALSWGLGHFALAGFIFSPQNEAKNRTLSLFLYRAVQIGVVLLATGTVLGGVWANYSWGRFWGWDPKETWALIALLGYLAVLHGRFAGWLGTFGTVAGCVIAFLGVVMAWYGVNYVLAAGLHSYGFGGGGAPYVLTVCLLDLALVLAAIFVHQRRSKMPAVKIP